MSQKENKSFRKVRLPNLLKPRSESQKPFNRTSNWNRMILWPKIIPQQKRRRRKKKWMACHGRSKSFVRPETEKLKVRTLEKHWGFQWSKPFKSDCCSQMLEQGFYVSNQRMGKNSGRNSGTREAVTKLRFLWSSLKKGLRIRKNTQDIPTNLTGDVISDSENSQEYVRFQKSQPLMFENLPSNWTGQVPCDTPKKVT